MSRSVLAVVCALCLSAPHGVLGQARTPAATIAAQPRGVYATIDLRPAQDMIRRLNASAGTVRRPAIREALKDPSAHMPPVLYALANALSGDEPENAVFWYHVGRVRAVYDALRCKDASARGGVTVLGQSLNLELRGSQYYQRDQLVAIATKAIEWDANHPRGYDQRWIALYGKVAASSPGTDPDEITVAESEWPAILRHVHEAHLKSVQDFAAEKKGR